MDPTTAAGYGIVLTLVGGIVLGYGMRELRPVYHILTNDPIPVKDLVYHDGPAEVEGTTAPTEEEKRVTAPFSDVDCLACEYKAQELRSNGKSNYWKTLDEGATAAPFLVEDRTGSVRVDPAGATLKFAQQEVKVPGGEEPPETIAQYIRQTDEVEPQHDETVDIVVTELNVGNDQRFIERRLDINESVYVYGDVERAPPGEWGATLVDAILTRGPSDILIISDTSERGTAWRLAKGPLVWAVGGLAMVGPGIGLLGYWLLASLA
ncbi:GIDE domain-containing protein [Halovenus rubra]|uniref:RING-type E3 ubiquitin transferase n=2 Tax=Halovenus rubra TaxID=869890 RepID=A0ABD5WZN5_9EURY|nr:GIDE domain-containing protein [Halovenus rubra]